MSANLTLSNAQLDAIRVAAAQECWRLGELSYKLDPTQLEIYNAIKATAGGQFVTEGARKLGKTYVHGCIALEAALQNPGKQINWGCGSAIACRKILVPILEEISADAPPECKGEYHGQTGQWRLPNGAFIQIFGAETKRDCERSRGPSSILSILDESGFIDLLEYLLDSILSPQQRRVKRVVGSFVGMTLLCSTTPYTPGHYFCRVADAAAVDGAYVNKTIFDSGFESPEEIDRYIEKEAAKKGMTVEVFKQTSTFKREFLSQRVVDETAVVFPEFHAARSSVVRQWPRPIGFEKYIYKRVSIDLGMSDKTGLLFGYVDFTNAKIVIEAEKLLDKPNTAQIAAEVLKIEGQIWPEANPLRVSRVIDDPHGRMILDLYDIHKLKAEKAVKHDREASIGMVRTLLQAGRLIISPDCVQLQKQLLNAVKNRSGNDFARDEEGHFDLCAALMYFVRDLSLTINPYPADFDVLQGRELPAHHPLIARRAELGKGRPKNLGEALLAGNPFVKGLKR